MFLKEVQYQKIENQNGWICPKCNISVAPTEKVCPKCKEALKEDNKQDLQVLID